MRLCRADNVVIFLREGENYRLTANYGYSREYEDFMRRHPIKPGRGTIAGRTALECRPVHVLDIQADPDYIVEDIHRRMTAMQHTLRRMAGRKPYEYDGQ